MGRPVGWGISGNDACSSAFSRACTAPANWTAPCTCWPNSVVGASVNALSSEAELSVATAREIVVRRRETAWAGGARGAWRQRQAECCGTESVTLVILGIGPRPADRRCMSRWAGWARAGCWPGRVRGGRGRCVHVPLHRSRLALLDSIAATATCAALHLVVLVATAGTPLDHVLLAATTLAATPARAALDLWRCDRCRLPRARDHLLDSLIADAALQGDDLALNSLSLAQHDCRQAHWRRPAISATGDSVSAAPVG